MDRIDKLTPEQEAMLPVWRDKWIEIGLKTGETDWETVEKHLPKCYEKARLSYPKNIVRVTSPLVGAFASSIADRLWNKGGAVDGAVHSAVSSAVRDAVGDAVDGAVHSAVGDAVGDAVHGAVYGAVGGAVDGAVDDAVHSAVYGAVGSAVYGAVGSAVYGAVGSAVHGAVGSAVHGAVHSAVGDAVHSAVHSAVGDAVDGAVSESKIKWHYWLGGQFWVGGWWGSPSYVSFFTDVCKLKLNKDIQERATAYRMVCESANYIWANKNFVMICARPIKINRNNRGMLHCENGKSIEYPDGWGLYHLNGVRFEEELYKKVISKEFSFSDRMKIVDIDQRTQAINPKFCDIEAFIKEANGQLLDETNKFDIDDNPINYKLYKFPKGNIFTEDAYYCYFSCPSTNKKHLEGVEKCNTVAEAMSWAMSNESLGIKVSPEDWTNMIPLKHEN